ncbi:MAG: hypothetical protein JXB49_26295 [Bacteroidales bacterium]|nr:hypothetical protein [Bacteroidales bacterium]
MPTIGILKETSQPYDARVALAPEQIIELQQQFPGSKFIVQPSEVRCYANKEYKEKGIEISEDLSKCDLQIGINNIAPEQILSGMTYLFCTPLLKNHRDVNSTLNGFIKQKASCIDLEKLTDELNNRLVTFGRWAGIVGAYNALRAYGLRNELYDLKPPSEYKNKDELFRELKKLVLPPIKILITGGGRVAGGVREVLAQLEIHKVSPSDFVKKEFEDPVFSLLEPVDYVKRIDNMKFELQHFYQFPQEYKSSFQNYLKVTDILITSHYWDPRSPVFMTLDQMKPRSFNISIIADISCDLNGPIPSTMRYSTLEQPFYGFDPAQNKEVDPFEEKAITVMAINNLPTEFPRDASEDFSKKFAKKVLPLFLDKDEFGIIKKGMIVKEGKMIAL